MEVQERDSTSAGPTSRPVGRKAEQLAAGWVDRHIVLQIYHLTEKNKPID